MPPRIHPSSRPRRYVPAAQRVRREAGSSGSRRRPPDSATSSERARDGVCVDVVELPFRIDAERCDDGYEAAAEQHLQEARLDALDVPDPAKVHGGPVDLPGRAAGDPEEGAVGAGEAGRGDAGRLPLRHQPGIDGAAHRPQDEVEVEVRRHAAPLHDAGFVAEPAGEVRRLRAAAVHHDDGRRGAQPLHALPERRQRGGPLHQRPAYLDDGHIGRIRRHR